MNRGAESEYPFQGSYFILHLSSELHFWLLKQQHPRETLWELKWNIFRQPWSKLTHLYGTVGLQEQVPAADAAVDAAQGHVQAEGEEVAMVEMTHAVIQPGWRHVQFKMCKTGKLHCG